MKRFLLMFAVVAMLAGSAIAQPTLTGSISVEEAYPGVLSFDGDLLVVGDSVTPVRYWADMQAFIDIPAAIQPIPGFENYKWRDLGATQLSDWMVSGESWESVHAGAAFALVPTPGFVDVRFKVSTGHWSYGYTYYYTDPVTLSY